MKPGGRIIELKKSDFTETVATKVAGYERKYVSFAFPELAIGDIIEFRWRGSMNQESSSYYSIMCQREVPVREFSFDVEGAANDYNVMWFNCQDAELKKIGSYRVHLKIKNLPAFEAEPFMPPEKDFRGWVMILFSHPYLRWYSSQEVWQEIGNYLGEDFRLSTKPNGAIQDLAKKLSEGAATPEEKLNKYYEFCQKEIANLEWQKSAELIEAKKKREDEDNHPVASETLRAKSGLSGDIDRVFAALARAGGFEVRLGFSADRDDMQSWKGSKNWIFMDRYCVAVKVGDHWRMYSPGKYIVPAGMMSDRDELATVFVCDEKKSWTENSGNAGPDATLLQRQGRFTLDEEGTLDGEVEITMTGHEAVWKKQSWWSDEETDATKALREQLAERIPGAEVSDVTWSNLQNRGMPLVIKYKVHIPGYAEVAGNKLVLNAGFFVCRSAPKFTAEKRRYPILFNFAEKIRDDVQIVVPESFTLEGGTAPQNVSDSSQVLGATYKVGFRPKSHTLMYAREQIYGGGNVIAFQPESYPALKKIFDGIKRSDDHVFLLKPKAVAAVQNANAATSTLVNADVNSGAK